MTNFDEMQRQPGQAAEAQAQALPAAAEALLTAWPLKERSDADWEWFADKLNAIVENTVVGSTDDALLLAPLPHTAADGVTARESSQEPHSAEPERSTPATLQPVLEAGTLDRAALVSLNLPSHPTPANQMTHDAGGESHTQPSLQIERKVRPKPEARELSNAGYTLARSGEDSAVAAAEDAAASNSDSQPADARDSVTSAGSRVDLTPWFGGCLIGIAVAAAFFVVFRPLTPQQPTFVVVPAQPATTPTPEHNAYAAVGNRAAGAEPKIVPAEAIPPSNAPNTSALDNAAAAANTLDAHASSGDARTGNLSPVAPAKSAVEQGADISPEAVVLDEAPEASDAKGASASKAASLDKSGSNDPRLRPASGTTEGIPERPSAGAAQVAIGAVLAGARGCVSGQAAARATVVFRSDGTVERVEISGPTAGTPAENCIRTALLGARVEPFAQSNFSVATTIRPN